MPRKRFGENLRKARTTRHLSQEDVAREMGIPGNRHTRISNWELKFERPPREDTVIRLARAIGCPVAELMDSVSLGYENLVDPERRHAETPPPAAVREPAPLSELDARATVRRLAETFAIVARAIDAARVELESAAAGGTVRQHAAAPRAVASK